ncbi:hypothetical protein [Cellulosimicrobium sp. TH-20]|uniref:hypothetical protein n=1 Tax=Cellulosimicrobium sp. TH-20 TaxID=1980001 RepID=UPI0011A4FB78|nr:hypothetical protein [Cellulosimicrobium sp. TH-20]
MTTLPLPLSALERRLGYEEGTLDGPDRARANAALTDATALVLAEVSPKTSARWSTDLPYVVGLVILKAARREFENPEGYRSQSLGEFSASVDTTSGALLTAREVAIVRRAATGRRRGGFVGSVRIRSAYAREPERGWLGGWFVL